MVPAWEVDLAVNTALSADQLPNLTDAHAVSLTVSLSATFQLDASSPYADCSQTSWSQLVRALSAGLATQDNSTLFACRPTAASTSSNNSSRLRQLQAASASSSSNCTPAATVVAQFDLDWPSSATLEATYQALYKLLGGDGGSNLTNSSNGTDASAVQGVCPPASANGTGWISAVTHLRVASDSAALSSSLSSGSSGSQAGVAGSASGCAAVMGVLASAAGQSAQVSCSPTPLPAPAATPAPAPATSTGPAISSAVVPPGGSGGNIDTSSSTTDASNSSSSSYGAIVGIAVGCFVGVSVVAVVAMYAAAARRKRRRTDGVATADVVAVAAEEDAMDEAQAAEGGIDAVAGRTVERARSEAHLFTNKRDSPEPAASAAALWADGPLVRGRKIQRSATSSSGPASAAARSLEARSVPRLGLQDAHETVLPRRGSATRRGHTQATLLRLARRNNWTDQRLNMVSKLLANHAPPAAPKDAVHALPDPHGFGEGSVSGATLAAALPPRRGAPAVAWRQSLEITEVGSTPTACASNVLLFDGSGGASASARPSGEEAQASWQASPSPGTVHVRQPGSRARGSREVGRGSSDEQQQHQPGLSGLLARLQQQHQHQHQNQQQQQQQQQWQEPRQEGGDGGSGADRRSSARGRPQPQKGRLCHEIHAQKPSLVSHESAPVPFGQPSPGPSGQALQPVLSDPNHEPRLQQLPHSGSCSMLGPPRLTTSGAGGADEGAEPSSPGALPLWAAARRGSMLARHHPRVDRLMVRLDAAVQRRGSAGSKASFTRPASEAGPSAFGRRPSRSEPDGIHLQHRANGWPTDAAGARGSCAPCSSPASFRGAAFDHPASDEDSHSDGCDEGEDADCGGELARWRSSPLMDPSVRPLAAAAPSPESSKRGESEAGRGSLPLPLLAAGPPAPPSGGRLSRLHRLRAASSSHNGLQARDAPGLALLGAPSQELLPNSPLAGMPPQHETASLLQQASRRHSPELLAAQLGVPPEPTSSAATSPTLCSQTMLGMPPSCGLPQSSPGRSV